MSWVDKQLRKHRTHKAVEQALKDPRFAKERQRELDEHTGKAINSFLLISVDFLHRRLGFGHKRLMRYLEFVLEQMEFAQKDREYFRLLNMELERETGINVLGTLGEKKQGGGETDGA